MGFSRDLQHAVRGLMRSRGYTAVVLITLALGIGASTAVFTVVNAVVFRALDYSEPQQLVRITSELRTFGAVDTGVSAPELFDYQARTDLFSGVAAVMPVSANVTSGTAPERVEMMLVSWNYFAVLGVQPALGRAFDASDEVAGVANVAVVSDAFWRRALNADAGVIGKTVVIDADPVVVIGVMPPAFEHPGRTAQNAIDAWSPNGFGLRSTLASRARRRIPGCIARLQPGVTLDQAQARLAEYGVNVTRQFPADYPADNGWAPRVTALQDDVVGGVSNAMYTLLGSVGLLLLIACVNVAHLVLARAAGRSREMAIRQAIGAGRGQLIRQLLTESAVIAIAGGALGLLLSSWMLTGLLALAPGRVPRIDEVAIDPAAVAVAMAIAAAATLIFGLSPAWQLRRLDATAAVREGGASRGTDGVRAGRARDALVTAEVAMATVLLIAAGLLIRSIAGLMSVPVGFDTDSLMTARITLPRPNDSSRAIYNNPERRLALYRETLRRLGEMPGVEQVALSSQIPLSFFNAPLFVELRRQDPSVRPLMHNYIVSANYFSTMRMRIVQGRAFTDFDRAGAEPVAIVSEAAARAFWRGRDPVGEQIRLSAQSPWLTVVGVASDVLNRRLNESPQPMLYQPLEQSPEMAMALLIRTRRDSPTFAQQIAAEIRGIDPDLPVYATTTMSAVINSAVAQRRFVMRLLIVFAVTATALALLGIYGVMAYAVSRRTRELGIRAAIGARQIDLSLMVLRQGTVLAITGLTIGVAASFGLTRFVQSQLFGVTSADPITLASAALLMTTVAGAAAYLPARRAARVNPVQALQAQ